NQEHHDLIAPLIELLRLDDNLLERLEQILEKPPRRLGSAIGPGIDGALSGLQLEFGMREPSCDIPVASVEGFVSEPKRFDICLRHRPRSSSRRSLLLSPAARFELGL